MDAMVASQSLNVTHTPKMATLPPMGHFRHQNQLILLKMGEEDACREKSLHWILDDTRHSDEKRGALAEK